MASTCYLDWLSQQICRYILSWFDTQLEEKFIIDYYKQIEINVDYFPKDRWEIMDVTLNFF